MQHPGIIYLSFDYVDNQPEIDFLSKMGVQ